MPSKKVLEQKQKIVDELAEQMKKAVSGVIVDYQGTTVEDDTKLRKELREAGVSYHVRKNTLLKLAAEKAGLTGLEEVLSGTTAIAMSDSDLVAPSKVLDKFAKDHDNFKLKAGFIEGGTIGSEQIHTLAKLPPKEVLIAQVLAGFNAPVSSFVNVLNANLRGLVVALNAIAEKQQKTA